MKKHYHFQILSPSAASLGLSTDSLNTYLKEVTGPTDTTDQERTLHLFRLLIFYCQSHHIKITELLGLEGTSGDHLV